MVEELDAFQHDWYETKLLKALSGKFNDLFALQDGRTAKQADKHTSLHPYVFPVDSKGRGQNSQPAYCARMTWERNEVEWRKKSTGYGASGVG